MNTDTKLLLCLGGVLAAFAVGSIGCASIAGAYEGNDQRCAH